MVSDVEAILRAEGFHSAESGWKPMSVYEAPAAIVSQFVDGIGSPSTVRRTLFDSTSLTPKERDTLVRRVKKRLGVESGVGGAAVDIALNPWVWLMFATAPAGPQAIRSTGRLFGSGSYNAFTKALGPFAKFIGDSATLLNGTPIAAILRQVVDRMKSLHREETEIVGKSMKGIFDLVERKTGTRIHSLDPRQAKGPARDYLQKLTVALSVSMDSLEKSMTELVPYLRTQRGVMVNDGRSWSFLELGGKDFEVLRKTEAILLGDSPKGLASLSREGAVEMSLLGNLDSAGLQNTLKTMLKEGDLSFTTHVNRMEDHVQGLREVMKVGYDEAVTPSILKMRQVWTDNGTRFGEWVQVDESPVTDWLRAQGPETTQFMESGRAFFKKRFLDLLGNEKRYRETGGTAFSIDENKLMRVWDSFQHSPQSGGLSRQMYNAQTMGFLEGWFGTDVMKMLEEGKLSPQQWVKTARETMTKNLRSRGLDAYFPRNAWDLVNDTGEVVPWDMVRSTKEGAEWFDSGRAMLRTMPGSRTFHPKDLEIVNEILKEVGHVRPGETDSVLKKLIFQATSSIEGQDVARYGVPRLPDSPPPQFQRVRRLDAFRSLSDYAADTSRAVAWSDSPNASTLQAMRDFPVPKDKMGEYRRAVRDRSDEWGPERGTPYRGARIVDHPSDVPEGWRPPGGFTLGDLVEGQTRALKDPDLQRFTREVLVPRVMGNLSFKDTMMYTALLRSQQTAKWLTGSRFGKTLESQGGEWGKKVMGELREFGERVPDIREGRKASGAMASWLYSSYLGLNAMSVMLNLTQPLIFGGGYVGYDNLMRGYLNAFRQFGGYISDRTKMGKLRITERERQDLIQKHFRLAGRETDGRDLLDISTDLHNIEEPSFTRPFTNKESSFNYWTRVFPMKFFEKGEWLNRVAMGEGTWEAFRRNGNLGTEMGRARAMDGVWQTVQRTQYGSGIENTPAGILENKLWLDSPVLRMFVPFQVRTLNLLLQGGGQLGSTRRVRGTTLEVPWMVGDAFRGLGAGAVAYEIGQNLLGADISRGLYAGTLTDIVGGDRFVQSGNLINAPPILDSASTAVRGLISGDARMMRDAAMRMLPAGVSASRVLNAMPDMGRVAKPLSIMQNQFVGWDQMNESGEVPIFRATDGTLVRTMPASEAVLRGLGMDLGRFKDETEIQRFLVKNAERMRSTRREYVRNVLAGDLRTADRVREDFSKQFGFPLLVKRDQWSTAMRVREEPRTLRSFKRIEIGARPGYSSHLGERIPREFPGRWREREDVMERIELDSNQALQGFTGF